VNDGLVAAFRPDLRVRLEGSAFALRHFAAEYRRALVGDQHHKREARDRLITDDAFRAVDGALRFHLGMRPAT
jgi:uncharacterized protein Usg